MKKTVIQHSKGFWEGMPEFEQEKQEPFFQVIVRFKDAEGLANFSKAIDQNINKGNAIKSIWYPPAKVTAATDLLFVNEEDVDPSFTDIRALDLDS